MQETQTVLSDQDTTYVTEETVARLNEHFVFIRSNGMQIADSGKYSCLVNSIIFQKHAMMIPRDIQRSVLPSSNGQVQYLYWYPNHPDMLVSNLGGSGEEVMMYEKTAQQVLALLDEEVASIKETMSSVGYEPV